MAAPGRRRPCRPVQHCVGGLILLPLQPPLSDDHAQERAELLAALGLPDDHQPDPEDLQPWWPLED